jgi:hypothetical protein
LTALERDEHIANWIELEEAKQKEGLAQVAPKPKSGRPESGVAAASRELRVERTDARRAVAVAGHHHPTN